MKISLLNVNGFLQSTESETGLENFGITLEQQELDRETLQSARGTHPPLTQEYLRKKEKSLFPPSSQAILFHYTDSGQATASLHVHGWKAW